MDQHNRGSYLAMSHSEIYINNKLKPTALQIHLCLPRMQSKALVVEKKEARGGERGRREGKRRCIHTFQIINRSSSQQLKHPTTLVILKSTPCRENALRYVNRHAIQSLEADALQNLPSIAADWRLKMGCCFSPSKTCYFMDDAAF